MNDREIADACWQILNKHYVQCADEIITMFPDTEFTNFVWLTVMHAMDGAMNDANCPEDGIRLIETALLEMKNKHLTKES